MIPALLIKIALVIIVVRSGYVAFNLLGRYRKSLLDLLYHASICILALSFLV
ncbi:hypothetical protein [Anaerobacillus alkaliphilus]|uniref:hypothetical protein n=1 Tax=Anaerobacillus alkaliphilus TaxID=1548597 RepID=UPI001375DBBA|nr:hypothetical protein [Anaerobacillus alkaliphilus]